MREELTETHKGSRQDAHRVSQVQIRRQYVPRSGAVSTALTCRPGTIVLPIKSTATVSQLRSELCNAVNYNDKAIVASAAAGLDDHLDAGSASTATAEKKPDELCFWTQATPGSVGAGSEEQVEWTRLEGDEDDDGLTIDKWRV